MSVHAEDSVGANLLDEIERVSALREQYRQTAKLLTACNVEFAVAAMTAAIDAAKTAIAADDGIAAIRCLQQLKGFSA